MPVSQETRDKMRASALGRKHSQATKDKIGAKHKGKVISQEAIDRQKTTMKATILANGGGFAVGPRSKEFGEAISKRQKTRPQELVDASVQAMNLARRGSKATDDQRERYRVARLKYMAENPEKIGLKGWFDTVPEREFAAELGKMGISYEKQHHTRNPHYLYDFLVQGRYLIEIDGPYHYDPAFYKTQEEFQQAVDRDAAKNMAAGKNGFSIYRIKVGQHLPDNWKEILAEQGLVLIKD